MKFLFAYKTIKNKVNYITKGDIIQRFKDFDLQHTQEKSNKDEVTNRERQATEELRKASMETFCETQNHNGTTSSSEEGPSKKRRRSEPETIAYLRKKNQSNVELQKEKLALQKAHGAK